MAISTTAFIQAYRTTFKDVQLFSVAKPEVLWTNDPIVRTSTMQSYIYPAIAKELGLYLVCELPTDAAYFDLSSIQAAGTINLTYPEPSKAVLCLEHENNSSSSQHEMEQLIKTNASLNILITYQHGSNEQQLNWANSFYRVILDKAPPKNGEFLLILPNEKQDQRWLISDKASWGTAELWRFLAWDKEQKTFYPHS